VIARVIRACSIKLASLSIGWSLHQLSLLLCQSNDTTPNCAARRGSVQLLWLHAIVRVLSMSRYEAGQGGLAHDGHGSGAATGAAAPSSSSRSGSISAGAVPSQGFSLRPRKKCDRMILEFWRPGQGANVLKGRIRWTKS
jgi:hypothetical protein